MLVIGRAQGMLMQQRDLGAAEALLAIATRAAQDRKKLRSAALDIVTQDSD